MKIQTITRQAQNLKRIEEAIVRWQRRLRRAANTLGRLEKRRQRADKALIKAKLLKPPPESERLQPTAAMVRVTSEPVANPNNVRLKFEPVDDLAIPTFLQRKKLDPVAEQIVAEQEARKLAKSRGRAAKRKAAKAGDLKRMPASGKDALAIIRGGE
jgi:hypothetical protein